MPFVFVFKSTFLLWVLFAYACGNPTKEAKTSTDTPLMDKEGDTVPPVVVAANRTAVYLPLLQGKKIGVVANQTSVVFSGNDTKDGTPVNHVHLIDSLVSLNIDIVSVFAPEHGFRGTVDAGEKVSDGTDARTGLPLISLYGKNRKPSAEQLKGLDLVLFDIQDVGVRFYTYIATLQLVMEACAENNIPIVVLDRPNPNAHYVDGPVMEAEHTGFLGMTEIPLVYGMTIGEYATMINEEGWLQAGVKADLQVVPLENWTHDTAYSLPIRPSPNLPNDRSINLYPSLGLFEGTTINAGRGTEFQFQRYGAPDLKQEAYTLTYTPVSNFGAKNPKHKGKRCYGRSLDSIPFMRSVSLRWLMDAYKHAEDPSTVFNTENFTKHAGTALLQKQIAAGVSESEIKKSWQADLEKFRAIRLRHLMYD